MITADVIAEAVRLLIADGRPTRVILFGSHARGEAREGSDLDLLVVVPHHAGRRSEMVRLRKLLRPLAIPVDVLVYTEEQLDEWAHLPGSVLYEAMNEGRVIYDAA